MDFNKEDGSVVEVPLKDYDALNTDFLYLEVELERMQTPMTQKPLLRAEPYAHVMRASINRKLEDASKYKSQTGSVLCRGQKV